MAKKNIVLSDEQFKDIKETILDNVLKVLPNIINEIFPVIMEKVSDIIKSNINDYVPVSRSTGHQAKDLKILLTSITLLGLILLRSAKMNITNILDVTNL